MLELQQHGHETTRAGVGSAGASVWTVVARTPGHTRLEFKRQRPWEQSDSAAGRLCGTISTFATEDEPDRAAFQSRVRTSAIIMPPLHGDRLQRVLIAAVNADDVPSRRGACNRPLTKLLRYLQPVEKQCTRWSQYTFLQESAWLLRLSPGDRLN